MGCRALLLGAQARVLWVGRLYWVEAAWVQVAQVVRVGLLHRPFVVAQALDKAVVRGVRPDSWGKLLRWILGAGSHML